MTKPGEVRLGIKIGTAIVVLPFYPHSEQKSQATDRGTEPIFVTLPIYHRREIRDV
jgi:hypothetical protein